jgi:hypothetical protein
MDIWKCGRSSDHPVLMRHATTGLFLIRRPKIATIPAN